jgi:hypothetical protein
VSLWRPFGRLPRRWGTREQAANFLAAALAERANGRKGRPDNFDFKTAGKSE